MGTAEIALTAHLVMPEGQADDAFLQHATTQLHERFRIEHVTLQVVRVPFTRGCAPPSPGAQPHWASSTPGRSGPSAHLPDGT